MQRGSDRPGPFPISILRPRHSRSRCITQLLLRQLPPYQLGLCLEALGDADDACEAYRHAMSVLDRGGPSGLGGLGDDIETLRLSISSACRSRLQTLARQTAT